MGLMGGSDASTVDPGTRASIFRVLDYVLQIELTQARWERVGDILAIAIEAAAAGDLDGVLGAVNELRAIGPVRVIRIGGTQVGPPPPTVREREDVLRQALMPPATEPEAKDGGDHAR
jgi:hypothetical protein